MKTTSIVMTSVLIFLLGVSTPFAEAQQSLSCEGLERAFPNLSPGNNAYDRLIARMEAAGCDEDGDGVINVFDICPGQDDTIDVDNDGIPDCNDPSIDLGNLRVTKVVEWGNTVPDPSVMFEICISGPTYPQEPSCVELGDGQSATWLELEPGEYTVTETDPGADWQVSGSGQVMVVAAGQTSMVMITNTRTPEPQPGSLQVTKVVEWGSTVPDPSALFEICVSGPTYPQEPSCVELGDGQSATWLELEPGEYTVTETDPGINWQVSGSGQVMVVAAGQTSMATITNTRIPEPG